MSVFLRGSGLMADVTWDSLESRARDVLEDFVTLFLQGGGSITPQEFGELTSAERVALGRAARRARGELAAAVGVAAQSARGAAEVLSPADGGAAVETIQRAETRRKLEAAADALAARVSAGLLKVEGVA